ncbi:DUF1932 domain-containing protein [Lapillicoccus sp.]|uniref:NAD(P)-dependent oxidoreductase n=1 Tax=Lapillicoccus sp. TaxID=1909287 RepID=UPI00326579D0
MSTIAVLHPGAMGAEVGRALVDVGARVRWLPAGRGKATQRRAEDAGLVAAEGLSGCDLVISVCPPGSALDVARAVRGFTGLYLDANAISPRTAAEVAGVVSEGGATYVDGGIIGGPPTVHGATRLYVSGSHAHQVAYEFVGSRLEAIVLESGPYAASATKMVYASWTKISSALLLAVRGTAAAYDVDDALLAEWAMSQPEVEARSDRAAASAAAKGWRWEAEMREIATTFAEAGLPAGFGEAAAEIFGKHNRPD